LQAGKAVTVTTSHDAGHSHTVTITQKGDKNRANRYRLTKCDTLKNRCRDGHTNGLWVTKPHINNTPPPCTEDEVLVGLTPSIEGSHRHWYCIDQTDQNDLLNGKTLTIKTTQNSNHFHELKGVKLLSKNKNGDIRTLIYTGCDKKRFCSDGHSKVMYALYKP